MKGLCFATLLLKDRIYGFIHKIHPYFLPTDIALKNKVIKCHHVTVNGLPNVTGSVKMSRGLLAGMHTYAFLAVLLISSYVVEQFVSSASDSFVSVWRELGSIIILIYMSGFQIFLCD